MNRHRLDLSIPADHPALAGHFPGFPIVPGVVLLDESLHAIDAEARSWHIGHVKFHHVVHPGDALSLEFEWQTNGQVHFELRVQRTLVASGTARRRAQIRAVASTR